jgi:hypothetical protein
MGTAPIDSREFFEDRLGKSLAERESIIKDKLQAAWQIHVARVQEELESGWQNHIGVAIEGVLGGLKDCLRDDIQQVARQLSAGKDDEALRSEIEALRAELGEARTTAEQEKAAALESLRTELEAESRGEIARRERAQKQRMQSLHKAVRRSEQAETRDDVVAALLDGVAPYVERAMLLQIDGNMITASYSRAQDGEGAVRTQFELPVEQAPALHNAKQAAEPLVAMRIPSEFSQDVLSRMGDARDEKLRIFPIISRKSVKALLVLEVGDHSFEPGAVEILTIAAGYRWVTVKESNEPVQLIAIQGTGPTEVQPQQKGLPWFQLSPQDQEVHLKAQRFARVQVAELRLYQSDRVRRAREENNIYGVFREEIDRARETFRMQFVETCSSMLDYYHMELVSILANDKEKVLGPDYPGPLV